MSHLNDVFILKKLIREYYKTAHPHIFIESSTDRQGWTRTWITKKMKEELKIHE